LGSNGGTDQDPIPMATAAWNPTFREERETWGTRVVALMA